MEKKSVGLALCGSYCTFEKTLEAARRLCKAYDITPIMSENAAATDTRFGKAEDFKARLTEITGKPVIDSIAKAEPIGPKALLDVLLIAPCTGNTLSKLANGITDSSVTMAAKAHLRNNRPVVIAVSTNDGLSGSAANIGALMARKNLYFVPFYQDEPQNKPCSLVSDFSQIEAALTQAMLGVQISPLVIEM